MMYIYYNIFIYDIYFKEDIKKKIKMLSMIGLFILFKYLYLLLQI